MRIVVEDVWVRLGGLDALRGVSLRVDKGESSLLSAGMELARQPS